MLALSESRSNVQRDSALRPNDEVGRAEAQIRRQEMTNSATDAAAAVLELSGSERPELLDFQIEALLNSPFRFCLQQLARDFEVPLAKLGLVIHRACHHLDRLEKRRAAWRDPAKVLESPNVAALVHVCRARVGRVQGITRRRRLETLGLKLERAHERARDRAWIEAWIGPTLAQRRKGQRADG